MEYTQQAAWVPLAFAWSDVGSWTALQEVEEADPDGNVVHGDVLLRGDRNCYLRADSRLLATAGLAGPIVEETPDAVLVAHRNRAQDVKEFVQELEIIEVQTGSYLGEGDIVRSRMGTGGGNAPSPIDAVHPRQPLIPYGAAKWIRRGGWRL